MRALIAVFALAVPLCSQATPAPAPTAPQVVVVQSGITARPMPTKIVRVAPAPATAPAGAYEGTRDVRDWKWYATGGPARANAAYAAWRTRFTPVHPFYGSSYAYRGYSAYGSFAGYRTFPAYRSSHARW